MLMQDNDVAATAGAGVGWDADAGYSDGTCNSRSYTRWCGRLLQTKECCCRAEEFVATAGAAEDDVECRCRLLMWQQQQEEKKIMWNAAPGYRCGSNSRSIRISVECCCRADEFVATAEADV
jgi:hypothetical protein